jgi:hypothetical protein
MDASKMSADQIETFNEELAKFKKKILPAVIRITPDNSNLFEAWFRKNNLVLENAKASQWHAAYRVLIPAIDFEVPPPKRVDMQGKEDRAKPNHANPEDDGWGQTHFAGIVHEKATADKLSNILREAKSLAENFVPRSHNHRIKQEQNGALSKKYADLKKQYPTPTVPQAEFILAELKKTVESFN